MITIVVLPYRDADWSCCARLTSEIVADVVSGLITGRYELPGICALTLVLQDALDGGVSTSLRVDGHATSNRSIIFEARL